MIIVQKLMHNGAYARYHKAVRMEIHADATHVIINSYHAPEMQVISWQDTYTIEHIPGFPITTLDEAEAVLTLVANSPFPGATLVPEAITDIEQAKARKWGDVKIIRDFKTAAGVEVTGLGTFDANEKSLARINAFVTEAMLAKVTKATFEPKSFTLQDNTVISLTAEDLFLVGPTVNAFISAVHARGTELREEINAAASIEDVQAINIHTGWPS